VTVKFAALLHLAVGLYNGLLCIIHIRNVSLLTHSFYKDDLNSEICEVYLSIKRLLERGHEQILKGQVRYFTIKALF